MKRIVHQAWNSITYLLGLAAMTVGIITGFPLIGQSLPWWSQRIPFLSADNWLLSLAFFLMGTILLVAPKWIFPKLQNESTPIPAPSPLPVETESSEIEIPPDDLITVQETINYLAEDSEWGVRQQELLGKDAEELKLSGLVNEQLEQAAFEGKIQLWGKELQLTQFTIRPRTKIPKQYWKQHRIVCSTRAADEGIYGGRTENRMLVGGFPNELLYDSLQLDRDTAYRLWPATP